MYVLFQTWHKTSSASPQARLSRMPTYRVVLVLGTRITLEKCFASAAAGQKLKEQF